MSFKKGNFYRCISNIGAFQRLPLTVGLDYECKDDTGQGSMGLVIDDNGHPRWVDATWFDPIPVPQVASSPVAAHAAATQPVRQVNQVPSAGTVCSCGKQAEKKVFATFEYFYCPACKTEVGGKAANVMTRGVPFGQLQPATPHIRHKVLPRGVSALKGEELDCANCGEPLSFLVGDLPSFTPAGRFYSSSFLNIGANFTCPLCFLPDACLRTSGELYVKDRGWV